MGIKTAEYYRVSIGVIEVWSLPAYKPKALERAIQTFKLNEIAGKPATLWVKSGGINILLMGEL